MCHPVLNRYSTPHWASANGSTRAWNPMHKGLHGLHWNPKFGLCWGLKKCHLHSWSALDWSGNVTHITGPCLQHGPLFSWFFDLHSRPPMMVPAGGPPPGSLFANGLPMAVLFLVLFLCCWCSLPWFWPVGTEGSEAQHVMLGVRKTSKKRCFLSVGCPSKQALHLRLGPCKWLHHRGSELNLMVKVERKFTWHHELGEFAGCFFRPFYSEQVLDLAHRNISRVFFPLPWFLFDL